MLMEELDRLRDHTAEEVLRRLLALSGYHTYLEANAKAGGEDRVANVDELVSAARQFDSENPGATVLEFLEHVSLATSVDKYDAEAGAVTLMTLHAAKGLEFPVVFVIGLEEGLLPHARATRGGEGEVEEERRLLFVGITRAQRELYLSHARVREFRGQRTVAVPSSFLGELPQDALEVRDRSGYDRLPTPRRAPGPSWPATGLRLTTVGAAASGSQVTPSGADLAAFRPGATVLHPQYGLGRIVAIEGAGPDRKGRVAFVVGGERTFVLSKSPLKPVGSGR
jgi:DNA helicase-2/ATP-dependent DNA helicase PcrA